MTFWLSADAMVGHGRNEQVISLHPGVREVNFQLMKQVRRLHGSQSQLGFESSFGFFDDVLRPPRQVERTGWLCEAQERIAERRIDQNARVEDDLKIGTHLPGNNTLSYRHRSSASLAI